MIQQLDDVTALNVHASLLGAYNHRVTSSLTTGNLIGRRTESIRERSVLGIWQWKYFRGKGEASLRIIKIYRPVLPPEEGFPGSIYSQHLKHFYNIRNRWWPINKFLSYLAEDITSCKNKVYQIILMVNINKYIINRKIRSCNSKLGLCEPISDRQG